MPKTLGIWEWGCPYHCDTAILDCCRGFRWQLVPRLPFSVPRSSLPAPRSPSPFPVLVTSAGIALSNDSVFNNDIYDVFGLSPHEVANIMLHTFEQGKVYYFSQREISSCESGSNLQRCVPIAFSRVDGRGKGQTCLQWYVRWRLAVIKVLTSLYDSCSSRMNKF